MKFLKRLLYAGASLLAMTAHAFADPITAIAGFLFAGPLGSVFTFSAIFTGVQVGLYAAGIVGSLLAGRVQQQGSIDPGQYRNVFETSQEESEVNVIGRARLGGLKIFGNTAGKDRYRLIGHAKGPLVAIEEYYLGGRPVTVDPGGIVSSPPFAKTDGSWVTWQTKVGDGTETAWPELISAFSGLWTTDHRVRGIAQSLVKYVSPGVYTEKFGELYQTGEPLPSITGRFNTVYDPRVPGADPDDRDTWVWSMNGPLCAARIMMEYPDLSPDDFDWPFMATEADRADILVPTLTGTEPRSQCSGVWLSEAKRGQTMRDVLTSIGAEIVRNDEGKIRIRLIDDDPDGEIHIPEKHIVDFNWRSGPEAVERPNVCRVRYYSPERNYEMADIDLTGIPWARVDDEVSRYGEKPHDIELPFCPSAAQAQRIARREFLLVRADTAQVKTNMAGMAAWGMTYDTIDLPDLDESPVCKLAPPRTNDQAGEVEIPVSIWPEELIDNPWNPATMEAPAPEPVPDLQYESDIPTPAMPSAAAVVQYPDGDWETRVKFSGVDGGDTAEANYRYFLGGLPSPWSPMTEYEVGPDYYAYAAQDTDGDRTEFRVRFANNEGDLSYFSDPLVIDPLDVDNSVPDAPGLGVVTNVDGDRIATATVTQMHLAELTFEWRRTINGSPDTNWDTYFTTNGRPGSATAPGIGGGTAVGVQYHFRVRGITSNGTPGPYATQTVP